jgi:hypothetical protein
VSQQRLPLPLGSPHPVRRSQRIFRGRPDGERTLLAALGMAAAVVGAVLTTLPPSTTVRQDEQSYRVGDVLLESRGDGVYAGPGGALVLQEQGGKVRAGASTHLNGEHMVGGCLLAAGGRSERCWFELGGRRISADDQLRSGGWDRRYDDGRNVRISLAAGRPIPVPFALGR